MDREALVRAFLCPPGLSEVMNELQSAGCVREMIYKMFF